MWLYWVCCWVVVYGFGDCWLFGCGVWLFVVVCSLWLVYVCCCCWFNLFLLVVLVCFGWWVCVGWYCGCYGLVDGFVWRILFCGCYCDCVLNYIWVWMFGFVYNDCGFGVRCCGFCWVYWNWVCVVIWRVGLFLGIVCWVWYCLLLFVCEWM